MKPRMVYTIKTKSNDPELKEFINKCSEGSGNIINHLTNLPTTLTLEISYMKSMDRLLILKVLLLP